MNQYNPVYNAKFTTSMAIMSRITARYKSKAITIDQINEWCGACELDEIKSATQWGYFEDVKCIVKNRQALTPCNVYRLLDIMDESKTRIHPVPDWNGTYLMLPVNTNYSYVYVTYYGLPINDKGELLILKGHEKACEYYCLKMMFEEDYMLSKFNGQQWSYILNEFEDGLVKAFASKRFFTRNEQEELMRIQYNMLPTIGFMPKHR